MEQDRSSQSRPPHVLVFPLPLQGHINSMIKLAELLAIAGFKLTFLNSHHNHERLVKFNNIAAHSERYPGFQFKTITDGLPLNHPRSGSWFLDMFEDTMELKMKESLREVLVNSSPPVDCIIGDGSPCCFWVYHSIPDIIQAGELPINVVSEVWKIGLDMKDVCDSKIVEKMVNDVMVDRKEEFAKSASEMAKVTNQCVNVGSEDMDRLITTVPGMETYLRCRDLPTFCRKLDIEDSSMKLVVKQTRKSLQADALILNTAEELDGPILSQIRTKCPRVYAVGPLHAQLNTRLNAKHGESYDHFSNTLWEVDKSCIFWLNKQPNRSVIYVSFGSITSTSREQLVELWYGLLNSKTKFLLVVRPNSVIGKDGEGEDVVMELMEKSKDRGYIVNWAPQEAVLNHPAIGGFFTHNGVDFREHCRRGAYDLLASVC
ncbi:hypothetical protein GOBAR_AA01089 [Gossypium barbadense]|uniref:UDP-glycosyltransferases domain-containing protein n=1 Tax=Gossypium barbadense TaxID=3634 RepID=A0A2P5YVB1_GOSBA|nr:hypothetical protein GOBAR_AA01089 [Gossypium barbadense]